MGDALGYYRSGIYLVLQEVEIAGKPRPEGAGVREHPAADALAQRQHLALFGRAFELVDLTEDDKIAPFGGIVRKIGHGADAPLGRIGRPEGGVAERAVKDGAGRCVDGAGPIRPGVRILQRPAAIRAGPIVTARRTAWRELLDDAVRRKFDSVLVFKLDRAFRSVKHMHDILAVWEPLGIGFLSAQERFDTTTALGRLLLNLLAFILNP
ncbi:Resolvase domain protein [Sulfobacillus acidophilus DSM 10332]|uniref:Resolvase domain protein n=1 Tax=Sulfobacillus acidophilus (strain ATCC 700253 / DSM 10332 / NAL) TaxID=679936 RepID=G8U138_SULAD|nr:Resolvase domain protein [Sulfobacillus acidophilus DSM 10332]